MSLQQAEEYNVLDMIGIQDPLDDLDAELQLPVEDISSRKRRRVDLEKEFLEYEKSLKKESFLITLVTISLLDQIAEKKGRSKKRRLDHSTPWDFVSTWSSNLFKRQFRVSREDFFLLRNKCIAHYPGQHASGEENYRIAQRMGNLGGGFVTIEIRLCVTLRMLAGASYLDLIWYGVSTNHVHAIFEEMISIIDKSLPSNEIFGMQYTADYLNKLSSQWSAIMMKKKGADLMKGTILAGDGLVVAINAPTEEDRSKCKVLDITHFRNRKGCFGIVCQAFCDAFGMFRVFEVLWPGSTNDITAYKQTNLFQACKNGLITSGYHIVLDEAYSSIGDSNHLTPFSKIQLKKSRSFSEEKYSKMKAFNFLLSSQRITIERAFGMLVRKFGILWKPLEHSLALNIRIIFVCAKLHNFCIQSWLQKNPFVEEISQIEETYLSARNESSLFMRWAFHDGSIHNNVNEDDVMEEDDGPNDADVMWMMENKLPSEARSSCSHQKKWQMTQSIYDHGIRYPIENDEFFLRKSLN